MYGGKYAPPWLLCVSETGRSTRGLTVWKLNLDTSSMLHRHMKVEGQHRDELPVQSLVCGVLFR